MDKLYKILYRILVVAYPVFMSVLFGLFLVGFEMESNIMFLLMLGYCFCVYTFFFMYFGNKVGIYRIAEIVYSNVLGLVLSNVLFFIVLLVVVGRPSFVSFGLMFVVQCLVTVLWTVICNALQLKLYGTHRIVLVHGEGKDPSVITRKLDNRKKRFFVQKVVSESVGFDRILSECQDIGTIMIYGVKEGVNIALTKLCYEDNRQLYPCKEILV